MNQYENNIMSSNRDALICGIDEVGRGPLAGPVVAVSYATCYKSIRCYTDDLLIDAMTLDIDIPQTQLLKVILKVLSISSSKYHG